MTKPQPGISGFAVYLPRYRVQLEHWCEWTENHWDKISSVVGRSFRMRGPQQNVYTMAAHAALRLIDQYGVDPQRIGYLALGTESSMDNSAGAVIVKGLLDSALQRRGQCSLTRACEVPEFKHACLGGIYGMKNALRYLAHDGRDRVAIVISADIAEYARGSTGEPTQGAGAVAMLLEREPKLLSVDLHGAGSSSNYRAIDFRKPLTRFCDQRIRRNGQLQDLPVFNGKYSTTCYSDATLLALEDLFDKRDGNRAHYFEELAAVFMHRPYRRMPQSAWALGYLFALARGETEQRAELRHYCELAGMDAATVMAEMHTHPDLLELVANDTLNEEAYPLSMALLRPFRGTDTYQQIVEDKMELGSDLMMDLGNIYTGALPGWVAAGCEEALCRQLPMTGREILTIGYGSGDAAEAIPMQFVADWQKAAARIEFAQALDDAVDLTQHQYCALHDYGDAPDLPPPGPGEFVISGVGVRDHTNATDLGIEFYQFNDDDDEQRRSASR